MALSAGEASADLERGTDAGKVLDGTPRADTIYPLGGPDLLLGFGEMIPLYGATRPDETNRSAEVPTAIGCSGRMVRTPSKKSRRADSNR